MCETTFLLCFVVHLLYLPCQVSMSWMSQRKGTVIPRHSTLAEIDFGTNNAKSQSSVRLALAHLSKLFLPLRKQTTQQTHKTSNLSMLAIEECLEHISSTKKEQPRRGVHAINLVPSHRPRPLLAAIRITGNWHCSTHSFTAYTRHCCTATLPLF